MRKPIFVVSIPEMMSDYLTLFELSLNKLESDYHVIVYCKDIEEVEFKLFSDRDISDIEIQDLRKELNLITK